MICSSHHGAITLSRLHSDGPHVLRLLSFKRFSRTFRGHCTEAQTFHSQPGLNRPAGLAKVRVKNKKLGADDGPIFREGFTHAQKRRLGWIGM